MQRNWAPITGSSGGTACSNNKNKDELWPLEDGAIPNVYHHTTLLHHTQVFPCIVVSIRPTQPEDLLRGRGEGGGGEPGRPWSSPESSALDRIRSNTMTPKASRRPATMANRAG